MDIESMKEYINMIYEYSKKNTLTNEDNSKLKPVNTNPDGVNPSTKQSNTDGTSLLSTKNILIFIIILILIFVACWYM